MDTHAGVQTPLGGRAVTKSAEQGAVIRGSGGLRKIRWRRPGMGKRGGLRVIYYWEVKSETFDMLTIYRKIKQEDLSPGQLRVLRHLLAEEFK